MKLKTIALIPAAILAFSGGIALATGSVTVGQRGLTFSVPNLTVAPGTTVTFNNDDTTSHNILVTGNGVNLNSGVQAPGVPFHAPFLRPGTYRVGCAIHPRMRMNVTVE